MAGTGDLVTDATRSVSRCPEACDSHRTHGELRLVIRRNQAAGRTPRQEGLVLTAQIDGDLPPRQDLLDPVGMVGMAVGQAHGFQPQLVALDQFDHGWRVVAGVDHDDLAGIVEQIAFDGVAAHASVDGLHRLERAGHGCRRPTLERDLLQWRFA